MNMSVKGNPLLDLLQIELANVSTQDLNVYVHSLPWVGWHSLILIAVLADALGTPLGKDARIDDPGPVVVTLSPGEILKGSISLRSRFPDFHEARNQRDVIVFWSYRLEPLNAAASERYCGHVVFPMLNAAQDSSDATVGASSAR